MFWHIINEFFWGVGWGGGVGGCRPIPIKQHQADVLGGRGGGERRGHTSSDSIVHKTV